MPRLVFSADDGFSGRELWTTDGTPEGTLPLADLWPGGGPGNPIALTPLGDGRAVFVATDPVHGTEPWVTDGTPGGTSLLLDINQATSGFASSNPFFLAMLDEGRALLVAEDFVHSIEPWVTDGTAAGTRVLEMAPGLAMSYVAGPFLPLGDGRALYSGGDAIHGTELWVTDGTAAGTHLVQDINPGASGGYPGSYHLPSGMISLGDGRALFSAEDGFHGRELWISDGTDGGTRLLADLWPDSGTLFPASSGPDNFAALGDGRVLFSASDPAHGNELWISDGTAGNTLLVADLWPGTATAYPGADTIMNSSRPDDLLPLGNGLALFSADDGVHGREFWITDGSAAGTRLVADIWPGGGPANPGGIPASPYPPSAAPSGQGGMLALGDGRALFSATDPLHGTELWITDGTTGGTRLVKDINGGMQGFASSTPSQFAALGDGRVVFTADDGIHGAEAWITDGTGAGTHLLRDIHPGATASAAAGYLLLSSDPGEDTTAGCRQPCQHTCDAWLA